MFSTISNNMLFIQWGVVLTASLVAAICDLRNRRIPNVLTIPVFISGIVAALVFDGARGGLESLGTGVIIAFPFVLLYAFAGGGAGDAKLMAAIGAWIGLFQGLAVLAAVCIAGGILGLSYAIFHKQLRPVTERLQRMAAITFATIRFNKGKGFTGLGTATVSTDNMLYMPYGLAIFCGVSVTAIGAFTWLA